jgi:hypothetical protein
VIDAAHRKSHDDENEQRAVGNGEPDSDEPSAIGAVLRCLFARWSPYRAALGVIHARNVASRVYTDVPPADAASHELASRLSTVSATAEGPIPLPT